MSRRNWQFLEIPFHNDLKKDDTWSVRLIVSGTSRGKCSSVLFSYQCMLRMSMIIGRLLDKDLLSFSEHRGLACMSRKCCHKKCAVDACSSMRELCITNCSYAFLSGLTFVVQEEVFGLFLFHFQANNEHDLYLCQVIFCIAK